MGKQKRKGGNEKESSQKMTAKKAAKKLLEESKTPDKSAKKKTPDSKKKATPTNWDRSTPQTGMQKSTPGSSGRKGRPLSKKEKKEREEQERLSQLISKSKKKVDKGGKSKSSKDKNRDGEPGQGTGTGLSHKKQKLNKWTPENMEIAVYAVLQDRKQPLGKRIGVRRIAASLQVPRNTLNQRVLGRVQGFGHMSGGELEPKLFSKEEEQDLANLVLKHADAGFPFALSQLRTLAYEYAKMLGLRGNRETEEMSRTWMKWFVKRHPEIKLKSAQQLSAYQAVCCNREIVAQWFEVYKGVLKENNIHSGMQVWNVDETGLMDVPKLRKVFGRSGMTTQFIVPKEKGTTTTVVCMTNALGIKTPPMVIHKGSRVRDEWKHCNNGAILRVSESGWINKTLFHQFGRVFLAHLKKVGIQDLTHVVLLDGHHSHTYNYRFLVEMYWSGVKVVCLPPHTSHFLQPLDNAPLAVFKSTWYEELRQYIRRKAGTAVSKSDFFLLFNRAWRAMTPPIIVRGFRETGIWPVDLHCIKEEKFALSDLLCKKKKAAPVAPPTGQTQSN